MGLGGLFLISPPPETRILDPHVRFRAVAWNGSKGRRKHSSIAALKGQLPKVSWKFRVT